MSSALAGLGTHEVSPLSNGRSPLASNSAAAVATMFFLAFKNFVSNHSGGKKYVRN
jgi:hypothetical protein